MLSATDEMLNRLDAWSKQLDAVQGTIKAGANADRGKDVTTQATSLQKKIQTLRDALVQPEVQQEVDEDFLHTLPRLHGEITWSSFLLGSRGQAPSQAIMEKTVELETAVKQSVGQFNDLLAQDVKTFNQARPTRSASARPSRERR